MDWRKIDWHEIMKNADAEDTKMTDKIYSEKDMLTHKAEAVRHERQQCIKIASEAVLKFRAKVDRRYYPGYHEDMRDYIKAELKKER